MDSVLPRSSILNSFQIRKLLNKIGGTLVKLLKLFGINFFNSIRVNKQKKLILIQQNLIQLELINQKKIISIRINKFMVEIIFL